ncbi:MAG: pantetheine-phosphate adenylyltransferase, partial [Burkholderiaceae bacterium]|nr:pantetheine-phosphate adenylyltransferase [Burkholderiaceae bacterium]
RKAFWFHDAVYGTLEGEVSDEEASARLWEGSGLDSDTQGVASLIRATDHFQASGVEHPLKNIMLGVDLAILGQGEEIYGAYAAGIRQEYARVPDEEYRAKRRGALEHLCAKAEAGSLYPDPYFAERYGEDALANMRREIGTLA